ncbi:hypothetical protein RJ640_003242 [Escallonia rubra]|uniref:Uncharacterized protein n=1 Tax=Escallonia rubra TaxID=112253 RepID=A0AA88R3J5_9ASTE|nr:hypothetical protein RJ640_003242 [Escallonia rubra]
MATPKLLLSKLLRHSRSTQTFASLYSSSIQSHHAPHNFSPSHAFTVHPLAPHTLSRSFSTRDSEFRDPNPGTDSAATHAEHWIPGFDTSVDGGGGSGTAEVLAAVSSGGSGESIFPVRALISLLDGYHDLTGFPWLVFQVDDNLFLHNGSQNWPISLAYLAAPKVEENCGVIPKIWNGLSAILMLVCQDKASQHLERDWIRSLNLVPVAYNLYTILNPMVCMPPPIPPPFSGRSYKDQFKLFMKERRAVGCPSYLWFVAYTSVQVPCFILWMTAIRRMALDHHSGFDYVRHYFVHLNSRHPLAPSSKGGALWFKNLTQTPSGVLGLIFPLLIAGLHLINVQSSLIQLGALIQISSLSRSGKLACRILRKIERISNL